MTLSEKINYEFQRFFLDQMRTSRENIFAHSREIEMKKKLMEAFADIVENVDKDVENILLSQNNLLESAYCFWCRQGEEKSVLQVLKEWLEFLTCIAVEK